MSIGDKVSWDSEISTRYGTVAGIEEGIYKVLGRVGPYQTYYFVIAEYLTKVNDEQVQNV